MRSEERRTTLVLSDLIISLDILHTNIAHTLFMFICMNIKIQTQEMFFFIYNWTETPCCLCDVTCCELVQD